MNSLIVDSNPSLIDILDTNQDHLSDLPLVSSGVPSFLLVSHFISPLKFIIWEIFLARDLID